MRSDEEKLRGCPTCKTPVAHLDLGLRDFQWVNGVLPGRVGGSDIDTMLEQSRTGRALVFEYKPDAKPLPTGQRLLLQWFVKKGADVWVVNDGFLKKDGTVNVGEMNEEGQVFDFECLTLDEFKVRVRSWWDAGFN